MERETEDREPTGAIADSGAAAVSGGDCGEGQQQEVDGVEKDRATEGDPHAIVLPEAVGSNFEAGGSSSVADGSPTIGRSSGDIGSSGAAGDDLGSIESPPRDSARGKAAAVEGAETTKVPVTYREEDVLCRPAATSSSQVPITKYDVAEHLPDEMLAKLLEDSPLI
ncbi:hypothetical protein RHMOL_Rhmol11G0018500 [Rhododendron molle]|uniref:Uncharacterized protein n=1 Tax=Rhododendron molle TaxID=49168 RepID=A0ACC0LNQ8_RHOML|nr:hypothetical protein RHMOL_Rhmol11G0018500 [Rhododendron molle]